MNLEAVLATATHLAAAVESDDHIQARRLADDLTRLACQAELQTIRHAAQRVVDALSERPDRQGDLGMAMIVLADEVALLISDASDGG